MPIIHKFRDWFFGKLPRYFKDKDTYKDSQGEGLMERYLRNFGQELDNEVVDFIHNFTDILDLKTTPNKYLPLIGFLLGSPPDIDGTWATYRRLLTQIVSIYKIKGTLCSFRLLFNLMGLDIRIMELPKQKQVTYDSGFLYDDGNLYDLPCEPCGEYDIAYWSREDDCSGPIINPVNSILLNKILGVICFLQPIDQKLRELARTINYCEDYEPNIENEVTLYFQTPNLFDDGLLQDDSHEFDEFTTTATYNYTF